MRLVCFSTQLPLPYPRPHPCPLQPSGIPHHCPLFLPSSPCCCCHCSLRWFQLLNFTGTVSTAHSNSCNQEKSKKSCRERLTPQIEVQLLVNKNLNQVTQDMPTSAQFPPTELYKPLLNRAGKHFSYFHFHLAYTP